MRNFLIPFMTILLLCVVLIYYQMGEADETIGASKQSEQLLKESDVVWSVEGEKVSIIIQDKKHHPITSLGEGEREKLNILAVNEEFSFFQHDKLTYYGEGVFEGKLSLKEGENYSLFLYLVDDEQAYTISSYQTSTLKQEKVVSIQLDTLLNKKVDGLEAALTFKPLFEQEPSTLTFSFQDDNGGKYKFNPLVKHKGMLFIVNQAMTKLLIVYPINDDQSEKTIEFYTIFPSAGIYKLWGEFQWDGKTKVFPYVIEALKKE